MIYVTFWFQDSLFINLPILLHKCASGSWTGLVLEKKMDMVLYKGAMSLKTELSCPQWDGDCMFSLDSDWSIYETNQL